MKKVLLLAILFSLGTMAFAQKVYFIFIQSEGGMPFYVKLGDKVHSSTASGYLILPKLKDSTYSLYLGRPGNQTKELRFSIPLNNTDRGFLLKNFQNGWALFDLQSMAIINPAATTSGVMYESNVVKTDLFSRLLAKAVDDSTLLMEPLLAKREEIKQEAPIAVSQPEPKPQENAKEPAPAPQPAPVAVTKAPEPVADQVPDSGNTVVREPAAIEPVAQATPEVKERIMPDPQPEVKEPVNTTTEQVTRSEQTNQGEYRRSLVKRYAEGSNVEGFSLTYLDTWEGVTDTIRLVIPTVVYKKDLVNPEPQPTDNRQFLNFTNESDSVKTSPASNNQATNANCALTASDKDFSELRKNMAAKEKGVDKLSEAHKSFRDKCFTTEQIRSLSALFLTEEGKLLFFKEAIPHVSDKERFNTLLFELKDSSSQDRFKALFHQ